jgi:uncharacterized membrane protein YdjX (TVP38/TMEM64 family)
MAQKRFPWRNTVRVVVIFALLVLSWLSIRWLKRSGSLVTAVNWISDLGAWGPLMFVLVYIVAAVLCVPASVLTLSAGILFGLLSGCIYVLLAAMIAATLSFLISRHIARDRITKRLGTHATFKALDDAVARDGWKIVALMRLAPAFPFSVTNYAFGLTRVPLWQYVLASFGMLPATIFYVYLGTLLGDAGGLNQRMVVPLWARAVIAVAALLVTIYITRFARRALKQREATDGTPARN